MILILIVMIVLQQLPVELQAVHNMLQKNEHLLMLRSNTTTSLPPTTSGGTKRHSRASDTSSAYSGSDVTTAVTVDDIDIDLSCLRESSVDSDDDETLDATEVCRTPCRNVYFIYNLNYVVNLCRILLYLN